MEITGSGRVLTSWQTGTGLGIAASGAVSLIESKSWRFQLFSSFIPAIALLFLVVVGSESPRWLIKKQRYCKAYSNLLRLRENSLLAARDLIFIWAQLQVETTLFMRTEQDVIDLPNQIPYLDQKVYRREISPLGYARRITQLFTIPRARRATLAASLVMLAQQMTGINVFAFLASTTLEYGQPRGETHNSSLWLFFGFGIVNFLYVERSLSHATETNRISSSSIAYFYIDSKGRRWLLMISLALIFPFLLITALSFSAHDPPKHRLVEAFLVLYTIVSSLKIVFSLYDPSSDGKICISANNNNNSQIHVLISSLYRPTAQERESCHSYIAPKSFRKCLEVCFTWAKSVAYFGQH